MLEQKRHEYFTQSTLKTRTTLMAFVGLSFANGSVIDLSDANLNWLIQDASIHPAGMWLFCFWAVLYYLFSFLSLALSDLRAYYAVDLSSLGARDNSNQTHSRQATVSEFYKEDRVFKLRDFQQTALPALLGTAALINNLLNLFL